LAFDIRHSLAGCLLLAALPLGGCRPAEQGPTVPPGAAGQGASAQTPAAAPLPVLQTSTGAEMVLVPAGRFLMGSRSGPADEQPPHEVTLDAFYIDRTEVTQEQYGKLVRENPSHFKGPKRPVEQISWAAAALYCNLRSKAEGLAPCYDVETTKCNLQADGYRLPTEAEWEYACRAGGREDDAGSGPRSLSDAAWFAENAAKTTHPVAEKRPNAWGLCDMLGNVAEWCNDVYEENYYRAAPPENPPGPADGERYVLRGGAWNRRAADCRPSARAGENPGFQDACFARDTIGFRCVRRAPAAGGGPPALPAPRAPPASR
jgi:formylglycine-generating enzyme required for sulfatase activity